MVTRNNFLRREKYKWP